MKDKTISDKETEILKHTDNLSFVRKKKEEMEITLKQ